MHSCGTDLLELLDDRVGARSTIITTPNSLSSTGTTTSAMPRSPTPFLGRFLHNACKIHLESDESMRQRAVAAAGMNHKNTGDI